MIFCWNRSGCGVVVWVVWGIGFVGFGSDEEMCRVGMDWFEDGGGLGR